MVRRAPFPVYGLEPGWSGRRFVHGVGVVVGEVAHVALGHGETGGEAELVVTTLYGEERAPDDAPFHAALHLEGGEASVDREPDADRVDARRRGIWAPAPIEVDRRDHVFWLQEEGPRWAAFGRVGRVRVVVAATKWSRAGVRLAEVDREAYLTRP